MKVSLKFYALTPKSPPILRFAVAGLAGVYGKVGPLSFNEFARKCAEATALPGLRYDAIRHNGRPVQQVAIVTGNGADPQFLREAISIGCDTFVTGEWWLFGPGEFRAAYREGRLTTRS